MKDDGGRRPIRSPFTFAIVELKLGFLVFVEIKGTTRGDGYDDVLYSVVKFVIKITHLLVPTFL